MSSSKCARCEQTVYPVEGLRCLDKIWHKGCFKCQECNMTLNMKNYKGFEKKPYCNAHCPQAKATTVADTPEIRRLAENTRIQSQAKYHEDFEKSKRKGFTTIADDPETIRLKNSSKIISNVAYHGEIERKKQMEVKRGLSGQEDHINLTNSINVVSNNNNSNKQQNRMQHSGPTNSQAMEYSKSQVGYVNQGNYQAQSQQQAQIQQQLKQQQHQINCAPDHANQIMTNRQGQHLNGASPTQPQAKQIMPQYPIVDPQQQQIIMRQHQMMLQQQQQRQSLELNRQIPRSAINCQTQQMIKHQLISPQQQQQNPSQMKFLPINEASNQHKPSPTHSISGHPMMNRPQSVAMINSQSGGMQGPHPPMHGYVQHPMVVMNGALQKQVQQQQMYPYSQPHQMLHPGQVQQVSNHQMRPQLQHTALPHQQLQYQLPVSTRVFRAMYDYEANDIDEVSFFENDFLINCVDAGGNWLIGKVARTGQEGMFPANYVAEYSS